MKKIDLKPKILKIKNKFHKFRKILLKKIIFIIFKIYI